MASLAEIRARLQAAEGNKGGQSTGGDNSIYPHWNMEEGQSATLRFLPDANTKNTFFWQERAMIRLPFAGIKGEGDSKQVYVQVPCVEMWGEACPILAEVRTWFKDKSLEEMGRKYWKKRSVTSSKALCVKIPLSRRQDSRKPNPTFYHRTTNLCYHQGCADGS
jgi:hypothetical protein